MSEQQANVVPDQGHWHFSTWKIDHYCLTPFEFEVSEYSVTFFIRTGHHVFKWEYSRVLCKGEE